MAVDADAVNEKKTDETPKTEPAKKAAPAKKTTAKKSSSSSQGYVKSSKREVKLGDRVIVTVNPILNNGASEAPGDVTRVLENGNVNVLVLLDTGERQSLKDVEVASKKPDAGEDGKIPTKVAFFN